MKASTLRVVFAAVVALVGFSRTAIGSPFVLSETSFLSSTLLDFNSAPLGPLHGTTVGGVTFGFTVGGVPSTSLAAIIDCCAGSASTSRIDLPGIVGVSFDVFAGKPSVMSLAFASPQLMFGYDFAMETRQHVTGATTVELFDASNNSLGSLMFDAFAYAQPVFLADGFAGVGSDVPFTRAQVTFRPVGPGPSYFMDNVRYSDAAAPVPEPATLLLTGGGLAGLWWRRRRRHT